MTTTDLTGGRRDAAVFPPYLYSAYRSSLRRAPHLDPISCQPTLSELTGPGPALGAVEPADADLTTNAGTGAEAMGERLIVTGRVLDADERPVPNTLIEIWQANAAGRYIHRLDQHHAPLDPNFLGIGRCLTDEHGAYRFVTIRPGAYPWRNHPNAWRPAHIHFSLFGPSVRSRLVTQMYFPGDPLHDLDPIMGSVPMPEARARLVARYHHEVTEPEQALGYRFDFVVRGPAATPFEPPRQAP
ncbi:MAG: protocatechuate 3,4-dioxygenase subunit beta [Egibacteraceae bacterium]